MKLSTLKLTKHLTIVNGVMSQAMSKMSMTVIRAYQQAVFYKITVSQLFKLISDVNFCLSDKADFINT